MLTRSLVISSRTFCAAHQCARASSKSIRHSSSPYCNTMPRSNSSVSLATSVLTLSAAHRWIVSSFFITFPIE
jgi:hypothetical protein